ncbi:MAG: DUF401 family protein [Chloroflexi bacterium]|nr:DUF401 family protein [Chloroflexota bacterium]
MPDIIKLSLIFVVVIFLLYRKWNLGVVLLLASAALGLIYFIPPVKAGLIIIKASIMPETLGLVFLLILIAIMEYLMKAGQGVRRIIESLRRLVPSRRLLFIIMPAFWGMLPSPGGALFSAPYLVELDPDNIVSPGRKCFLNYWFRHIWEYIFPIYPAVILSAAILHIPYRSIFLTFFPLTLAAIAGGLLFGFLGMKLPEKIKPEGLSKRSAAFILLREIAPILILLILVLAAKIQLLPALGIVVAGLFIIIRPDLKKWPTILKHSITLNTTVLIFGTISFQEMLKSTGCLGSVSAFLSAQGMPESMIFIILPMIIGILTGSSPAMVAISFPILLSLRPEAAPGMFAMAFGAGFSGVMLSPLHLCLALTLDYFKTTLGAVYRIIWAPVLVVILTGIALWLTGK